MPIATRLTNTGTLLVNGSFDENTSIAPANFRTTSTTVLAGTLDEVSLQTGAISFNGTSQYLTAASPNLSGTWTVEMWCYWITGSTQTTIVSFNNGSNSGINLWKNSSNQLVADDGVNGVTPMSTVTPTINAWNHIAFVRVGTTTSGYVNGVLAGTTTYTPGTTSAISVGRYNGSPFYYFPGYISNLRVVNGTAVYTAAFTPPQAILPAISGTSFLLNVVNSTNFIQDNSSNAYTVTNNGTATWTAIGPFNQGSTTLKQRQLNDGTLEVSTQFDEFTGAPVVDTSLQLWLDAGQTASYSGSGATWTDLSGQSNTGTLNNSPTFNSKIGGGTFLFNGTNQTATTASLNLQQNFTLEAWVNQNVLNGFAIFGQGTTAANQGLHIWYVSNTSIRFGMFANDTDFTVSTSTGTWYHMIFTYNHSSPYTKGFYLNAVAQSGTPLQTAAAYAGTGVFRLGATYSTAGNYGNGYFEGVKMYNRILTADEITTNFNALRGRYGV
jgi:hypothetical protein